MNRMLCACVVVAFVFIACGNPPPPDKAPPLSSRVELAAGDVWLGKGEDRQRLITGAMLPQDAGISLGKGARALIRLGSGTGVFLRGGTVADISGEEIALRAGEIWADVPKDEEDMAVFRVGDITVTASDVGLDIAMKPEGVTIYVARGLAVVESSGGRTEVQSGEQAVIEKKGEPIVEPVSFWEDWTGGMADRELLAGMGARASGQIYGIDRDRPGSPPQELQITFQSVRIFIRDGIAHTTVDQRFFNPSSVPVEGWYWFTVPQGASVERFAWEVDGVLVDGEMIERKQAAATYEAAVRARTFDPALLEWVDGRTFRARIYPVPATGEKRVVLSYTELLPLADGVYRYVYPMGGGDEVRIQEFSLKVDLGDEGEHMDISTLLDARVEKDGTEVSMRRSGFVPRSDFLLEMRPREEVEPLRVMRFESGKDEADYVMLRYSPEVEWNEKKEIPGDVVVVLDTSAGGDDSDRQVRADAVEAILRALSDEDHFAVVAADLTPRVLYPAKGLALAKEENVSAAVEILSEVSSSGATDLGAMFGVALELVHEAQQPAVVYVGDGLATVGETSSDKLTERFRRSLGDSKARFFTIAVGADANTSLLKRLAGVGGGSSFRVDSAEQTVQEALRFVGMLKTPTITDLEIEVGSGMDQLFSTVAGKVSEGQEIVLLARTHHALPDEIKVTGRLGDQPFEKIYKTEVVDGDEYGYIPSIWARLYLERMMGEGIDGRRGSIITLGLKYGLMTPFTSFLVLENEQAYMLQGVKRRSRFHRWSALDSADTGVKIASKEAVGFPLFLFGCSDMSMPAGEPMAKQEITSMELDETTERLSGSPAPAPPTVSATAAPEAEETGEMRAIDKPMEMGKDYAPRKKSSKRKAESRGGMDDAEDLLAGSLSGPINGKKSGSGTGGGYGPRGEKTREIGRGLGTEGVGWTDGGEGQNVIAVTNPYTDTTKSKKKPLFSRGTCSDASRRPLYQRRVLWRGRLMRANDASGYLRIFREAGERCELPRWKQRKVLLDLIEGRARSGEQVRDLLSVFRKYPSMNKYLRRKILKRALDPDVTMGLYFPSGVDWAQVQRGLAALKTAEKRVAEVRKILESHPDDPMGRSLLIYALVEAQETEEAMAVASRLRRDGMAGPSVLAVLCDLQAEAGMVPEARRTCSELVEFNSDDPGARQRLGDLFLRQGWYADAYRQYKTLVETFSGAPGALLRLAAAAAGMGKVDEALRIERKVASGDGEPGPMDPRRWARLHSAARLAGMILDAKASNDKNNLKALLRNLKRTQVFGSSASIVVLVWEDLHVKMDLKAMREDEEFPVSERISADHVGLQMMDLGRKAPADVEISVKLKGAPLRRAVQYKLFTITWDGKTFAIDRQISQIEPGETGPEPIPA